MATAYDAQAGADGYDVAGGGWITFAALMLGLAGTFNVIDGIVALSKSSFFTTNATYVFSDLRTWGWIVLILGVLQLVAAFTFGGAASSRAGSASSRRASTRSASCCSSPPCRSGRWRCSPSTC